MVVNGFVSVVISTIEKRFDMASSETGFVASAYDVASVLCLIPVSYFGGLGHKPRWLGIGVLLLGTGSLLFALPHFTSTRYRSDSQPITGMCPYVLAYTDNGDSNTSYVPPGCEVNEDSPSGLSKYKYMFIFAQLFHGIGATPCSHWVWLTWTRTSNPMKHPSIQVYAYCIKMLLSLICSLLYVNYMLFIKTLKEDS